MDARSRPRLGTATAHAGRLLVCCLLPIVFCASAGPARSAPPEPRAVTVGITRSFPPYYSLDEDGNPVGFAVEVMDAVAERAGLEVSYSVVKTGGDILEALLAGRIDIIPSLGISEKRARQFAFTAPIETFHVSLFVRDDTQDVRGLDDLAGRKVAVIAENVARHLLAPRDDIALQVFPLFTDALFALLAGRVDALAYPEPVAWSLAREARVADQLKVVGRPLFEIKRAIAVRKDNVELLALLDLAVAEFVASPDYRRIYVAWFGEPSPFWTLNRKPTVSPLFIPAHSASRNLA